MIQSLGRLRREVTFWYVGTFGAILVAFGIGLFLAIRRDAGLVLDRSLARATGEVRRVVTADRASSADMLRTRARGLRIPDRALYLFGTHGAIYPDTASVFVRTAASRAFAAGESALEADIGHEHALRVHAVRFTASNGDTLVAVAATATEELEDAYSDLITLFAGALGIALACVGIGGHLLARRATAPIEDSIERMRRFMAEAAHELRTPVSYVLAHADVALQQSRSTAEYVNALEDIGNEARRLGTIVNDLFLLARADAGERTIQPEEFFLDDVVLEAAGEARTIATIAGVHIDVTDFEETMISGDLGLVRQLIRIVLDNAIKYTRSGGHVRVSVTLRDTWRDVVFQDSGIGIRQEALPRIYDRFYRDELARETADGAGLGLSIAKWIAAQHGARLEITSAEGRGTRVRISFPAPAPGATVSSSRVTLPQTRQANFSE